MTEKELLNELLKNFYVSSEGLLEWMWIEGSGPHDFNKELTDYYQANRINSY